MEAHCEVVPGGNPNILEDMTSAEAPTEHRTDRAYSTLLLYCTLVYNRTYKQMHAPYVGSEPRRVQVPAVLALVVDHPVCGVVQAEEEVHQGGLPTALGPHDGKVLAHRDKEGVDGQGEGDRALREDLLSADIRREFKYYVSELYVSLQGAARGPSLRPSEGVCVHLVLIVYAVFALRLSFDTAEHTGCSGEAVRYTPWIHSRDGQLGCRG
jgi:hypothetical protein